MRALKSLNDEELKSFFNSFDLILSDVHGVLFNISQPIKGSPEAFKALQEIGKRIVIVSNNSMETEKDYNTILKNANFEVPDSDIVTPISIHINFLKSMNFSKKIFLLGAEALRKSLIEAGFEVLPKKVLQIEDSFKAFLDASEIKDEDVGAVIVDTDLNLNFINLEIAHCFLKNPDVLFLKGAADKTFPLGENRTIIGPGAFHEILENVTGRQAFLMGKPTHYLNEYAIQKFDINDPSRVLFIGDSIQSDMAFGTTFGYQTLLVFSGLTKKTCLEKWDYPDEFKPDFYIDSLQCVHNLISRVFK